MGVPMKSSEKILWPLGFGEYRISATQWGTYQLGPDSRSIEMVSQSNPRLAGGRWLSGGPWILKRDSVYSNTRNVSLPTVRGSVAIGGPQFTVVRPTEFVPKSDASLIADGTTAIARTEPTNPAFSLSEVIGELRAEGLPNLPGSTAMRQASLARSAGSEYLNIEFGWNPLIRSVRDFAKVVDQSDQILTQYNRDSGRLIRRRLELANDSRRTVSYGNFSVAPSAGAIGSATGSITVTSGQRTWFSGAFVYHLPTGNGVSDTISRYGSYARKLLGVELTPEVLWNLAPWSWAADWFGNVGDVAHNISAIGRDGLVMKYGYMMCHTFLEEQWRASKPDIGPLERRVVKETKRRIAATPYGFGVDLQSLTTKQIAILAALGLSRA